MKLSIAQRLHATFGLVLLALTVSALLVWRLGVEAGERMDSADDNSIGTTALADTQSAVNQTVSQLDQMTQQNAALVGQSTAAAAT